MNELRVSTPPPAETMSELLQAFEQGAVAGYTHEDLQDMSMIAEMEAYVNGYLQTEYMEHLIETHAPSTNNHQMFEDQIDPPEPSTQDEEHQTIINLLNRTRMKKMTYIGAASKYEYGFNLDMIYEFPHYDSNGNEINPFIHIFIPKQFTRPAERCNQRVWLNIHNVENIHDTSIPLFKTTDFPLDCAKYILDCVHADKVRYTSYANGGRSYWLETPLHATQLVRRVCKFIKPNSPEMSDFEYDDVHAFVADFLDVLEETPMINLIKYHWLCMPRDCVTPDIDYAMN